MDSRRAAAAHGGTTDSSSSVAALPRDTKVLKYPYICDLGCKVNMMFICWAPCDLYILS